MPKSGMTLTVELEDSTFDVSVDQRDYAALEATDYGAKQFLRARFLAWNAAVRAKQYTGTWERFNAVDAIEVRNPENDPEGADGDDGGLDPGRSRLPAGG